MKRFIAILTLGAFLQACMRWGTKPLEPTRFDGAKPDREVRVTVANGGVLVVKNPFISGDSLVWLRAISDEPAAGDAPRREQRQGIPLAQIRSVQVREVDAAKTALLVVGTVGLVALLVATANSLNDWGSSGGGGSTGGGGSCDYCSSCPLVYSWDGHRWRLDSGTFGGAIMHAHARTDVDNLAFVQPDHGVMRLKLANEQRETDYVDALSVLAVDHDSGLTVAPDAAGGLHTIGALTSPVAARDFRGRDALAQVRAADGWNWESSPGGRAAMTVADLRDGLELAFPRRGGAGTARLVVDGNVTAWAALMMERFVAAHGRATQAWYDSLDRDTQGARRLGEALARQAFLSAAVLVDGRWQPQGLIWDAGRQGANLPASHARVVPNPRAGSGRAGRGAPQCVAERSAGDLQGRRGKDERGAGRDGRRGPMSGRVVWVTGLGAVTGAGVGAAPLLDALRAGRSCVRPLPELDGLPAAPATGHRRRGAVVHVSAGSVSAACAIGEAFQKIAAGLADLVVAGGAECPLQRDVIEHFRLVGILATPSHGEAACRPFDPRRTGTVLGEGAGALVLEDAKHAARRGARPRAVITGFGLTCEAFSMVSPEPGGAGVTESVRAALGARSPDSIGWIKTHGTGTKLNDAAEG